MSCAGTKQLHCNLSVLSMGNKQNILSPSLNVPEIECNRLAPSTAKLHIWVFSPVIIVVCECAHV